MGHDPVDAHSRQCFLERLRDPLFPRPIPGATMRTIALSLVMTFLLVGCDQPSPDQPAARAAPEAAPAAAPETAPAPTAPAETVVAKAPEGTCGDQSALPAEERIANTPKWSLAS